MSFKTFVLFSLVSSFSVAVMARDKDDLIEKNIPAVWVPDANDPEICFSSTDIDQIKPYFAQIAALPLPKRERLCTKDLGPEWTKIIETLLDIKKFTGGDFKEFKTKDDTTRLPIAPTGWWTYLTERAEKFDWSTEALLGCGTGALAYVSQVFFPKVINICPSFFTQSRVMRLQAFMHEARHSDVGGYSHVKCEKGDAKGLQACDQKISDGGSYAVQVQVAMTIGLYGSHFSREDRALARSMALSVLENRFRDEQPKVQMTKGLYLENAQGQVFRLDLASHGKNNGDRLEWLTQLPTPSRLYSALSEVVIFPLDTTQMATRKSEDLKVSIARLGLFASDYNSATVEARGEFKDFSYGDDGGGYILEDVIALNCVYGPAVRKKQNELQEPMTRFFVNYLRGASGQLYTKSCENGKVVVTPANLSVENAISKAVQVQGKFYALDDAGQLRQVILKGAQFQLGRVLSKGPWIDLTGREIPAIFAESLEKN